MVSYRLSVQRREQALEQYQRWSEFL